MRPDASGGLRSDGATPASVLLRSRGRAMSLIRAIRFSGVCVGS
jgi:hypothetical protein